MIRLDARRGGWRRPRLRSPSWRSVADSIRTSIYDAYSASIKFTTHLHDISHCKRASGTDWSSRWTYREFIINTRRGADWTRGAGAGGGCACARPGGETPRQRPQVRATRLFYCALVTVLECSRVFLVARDCSRVRLRPPRWRNAVATTAGLGLCNPV